MADEGILVRSNEMVTWCFDVANHERHSWTEGGTIFTCVGTNGEF